MFKRKIFFLLLVMVLAGVLSSCNNNIPCPAYASTSVVR